MQVKEIEKRDSVLTPKQQIDRLSRPGATYFNLNPFDVSTSNYFMNRYLHCHLLSLHPIEVAWLGDSEHPCHLLTLNGNLLVGFMCVHGPSIGALIANYLFTLDGLKLS